MVRNAEETARAAEADFTNSPGMCLQQCRMWADIPALFGTAAIAWQATLRKHYDRNPPRGAFVFWTGGSRGFGHITVSLGGGRVRSTDAGGTGVVATRTIGWFDVNWPSQNYVGWTDNVNGVTVPGVIDTRDGFDMADLDDLRRIIREENQNTDYERIRDIVRDVVQTHGNDEDWSKHRAVIADEIDKHDTIEQIEVTKQDGTKRLLTRDQLDREVWQKINKHTSGGTP